MSISYRKLDINLSADKETVLVFGQEMSTKYFTEIVVTSMLNGLPALSTGAHAILTSLHAAGLNANDYGAYSRAWSESNAEARREAERQRIENEKDRQRIAAMYATPEEIAKEAAERKERKADLERRFSRKGAAFGL
ncbi:TPA: hypothetical protein MDZ49_001027 [Klebsiella pneumoniae]|uniref:DUF6971 domain-containing protein n=2 Tax=Enterobacteriaceae TaxID=543 RepID=A0A7H9S4Y2_ECOLX|nr:MULTISPECIES: hypothetical protein [Enterobacteriaceae]HBQ5800940.1 hypothetical protein [Klebsiella pneumoniae subsp. pneumoniae]HDH1406707.1 hypothetical protein [Klebsiella quasipneumoniae subsp. similipneumoniae]AXS21610.1 hypothetical protein D0887_25355 [Klebsiella pneumoniae]EEV6160154.1 hypothetical protein [Escherichia coli]EFH4851384.1 hypothetical protein [Escherichia coli]